MPQISKLHLGLSKLRKSEQLMAERYAEFLPSFENWLHTLMRVSLVMPAIWTEERKHSVATKDQLQSRLTSGNQFSRNSRTSYGQLSPSQQSSQVYAVYLSTASIRLENLSLSLCLRSLLLLFQHLLIGTKIKTSLQFREFLKKQKPPSCMESITKHKELASGTSLLVTLWC